MKLSVSLSFSCCDGESGPGGGPCSAAALKGRSEVLKAVEMGGG